LNTDNWQATGAFCHQRGNSTFGCDRNPILVSPRPLVASHATVDRNSWTDPEIGPIHITCGVDIEYGWIIEPIESTQKQIPQNQTKSTIPYSYILKDLAGYAAMDTPTTGGFSSNTKVLLVKNFSDKGPDSLRELVKGDEPKIIIFEKDGEIKLKNQVFVGSNTSILALNKKITIKNRGLLIKNESNVIVAGLEFTDGKGDAIEIRNSHHVWIDHITAQKYSDGLIDIVSASHNVTVSRSKLTNHEKVILIGNSSTDTQVSKVTLWGNYFSNFGQRSPRVRYGTVDMYNNVIENWTNSGIRSTLGAIVNVQNNIFIPGDVEKLLPRFAENFKDEPRDEPGNIILQGNFSPNPTLQNVVNTSKFINAAIKYTRPYPAYPPSMQKSSRLPFPANAKLMKQIKTSAGRQPSVDTKID
ncbi:MAG: polysaccharide lyase family 1 protein, partial [Microgenomates group bacterium]